MVMDSTRRTAKGRAPQPDRPTVAEALRGMWAVLLLILTGIEALFTALIGIRPISPVLVQLGHVMADEYRAGRHGYVDVSDDPESEVEP